MNTGPLKGVTPNAHNGQSSTLGSLKPNNLALLQVKMDKTQDDQAKGISLGRQVIPTSKAMGLLLKSKLNWNMNCFAIKISPLKMAETIEMTKKDSVELI